MILRNFGDTEEFLSWIFEQPEIRTIDDRIMQIEVERGNLMVQLEQAPYEDYPADYKGTPFPEPIPKSIFRRHIARLTVEHVRLQRQSTKVTLRTLRQLSYPPRFS